MADPWRTAAPRAATSWKGPEGAGGAATPGTKKDERPGGGRAARRRSKARISSGRPWRSQMSPRPRGEEEIASSPIVTYYDTVEGGPARGWKLVMDRVVGVAVGLRFGPQRGV